MRIPGILGSGLAGGVLLLAAACGDDGGALTGSTPVPTTAPGDFGPAPAMTAHVTSIAPSHAAKVRQANTRPTASGRSGVCADVSYTDLPENNQWFRMAVDAEEVTQKLTLIVDSRETPTKGTICFAPQNGLATGVHTAAIVVQDPRATNPQPLEQVAWSFEVVP